MNESILSKELSYYLGSKVEIYQALERDELVFWDVDRNLCVGTLSSLEVLALWAQKDRRALMRLFRSYCVCVDIWEGGLEVVWA